MILTCEYCGAEMDTEHCDVCPFCGGTFQNNKDYIAWKAREEEADRLDMEQKKIDIEKQKQAKIAEQVIMLRTEIVKNSAVEPHTSNYFDAIGNAIGKVIGIIVMLVFLIGMVSSCISDQFSKDDEDSNSDSLNYTSTVGEPVYVNYKAQAETSNYTILCDSYKVINNYICEPMPDRKFVGFHFVLKNISNDTIKREVNITCDADGNICSQLPDNTIQAIPQEIEKGAMVTGYVCFEVPTYAEAFDIQYGDYVTIHIKNPFKEKMTNEENE